MRQRCFSGTKGGDYLGRDFRPDADGVDHNTIRHLPCKFHVHNLFHFWLFAGRCRACRMDFLQAEAISCTNGFPSARRNGPQPAGCLLLPHGLHEKGCAGGSTPHRRGCLRGALHRTHRRNARLLVVRAVRHASVGYAHCAALYRPFLLPPCNSLFPHLGVPSFGAHAQLLPAAARAKSGKRIISSFIIKGAVIKMPLRKWMPCSGFAGQGLRAFAAGRAPRCAKLPFTQRRKPNRRLAEFRPLSANEWQETSSDFFSDFVTYPL